MAPLNALGNSVNNVINTAREAVDDVADAGTKATDDVGRAGLQAADEAGRAGLETADELARAGVHTSDELARAGINTAGEVAQDGIRASGDATVANIEAAGELGTAALYGEDVFEMDSIMDAGETILGGLMGVITGQALPSDVIGEAFDDLGLPDWAGGITGAVVDTFTKRPGALAEFAGAEIGQVAADAGFEEMGAFLETAGAVQGMAGDIGLEAAKMYFTGGMGGVGASSGIMSQLGGAGQLGQLADMGQLAGQAGELGGMAETAMGAVDAFGGGNMGSMGSGLMDMAGGGFGGIGDMLGGGGLGDILGGGGGGGFGDLLGGGLGDLFGGGGGFGDLLGGGLGDLFGGGGGGLGGLLGGPGMLLGPVPMLVLAGLDIGSNLLGNMLNQCDGPEELQERPPEELVEDAGGHSDEMLASEETIVELAITISMCGSGNEPMGTEIVQSDACQQYISEVTNQAAQQLDGNVEGAQALMESMLAESMSTAQGMLDMADHDQDVAAEVSVTLQQLGNMAQRAPVSEMVGTHVRC